MLEAARSADDWASETPSQQRRLGTGRNKKKKTTQKKTSRKRKWPGKRVRQLKQKKRNKEEETRPNGVVVHLSALPSSVSAKVFGSSETISL